MFCTFKARMGLYRGMCGLVPSRVSLVKKRSEPSLLCQKSLLRRCLTTDRSSVCMPARTHTHTHTHIHTNRADEGNDNAYVTHHKTLCLFARVCVCVCVCVSVWVCLHTCRHGGVGELRHDLCYILHNVILNQKSAMLCLDVCVKWLRKCARVCVSVCSCVCACVYEEKLVTCEALSKCYSHLYYSVIVFVCARERVFVCAHKCVYVFRVSRCLLVRIAESQNEPCSLENKPFQTRDVVPYMYHVEQSHNCDLTIV